MSGVTNVLIKIAAETAGAVSNIKNVNTALGEQMTTSQKASSAIKKAAVPAAAAFALVGGAVLDFTQAAAEDADAQTKLAGTLKRTTGASDDAVKSAEKYIDKLSQQVAIADDDLRPALGKLAAATGSVKKGQEQLAIAADIAAQAHVPLATATQALVKADQGRYGALQKLVPAIDETTIKSKDQQKILDETAKLTAGAATEAAGTYEGQQQAMKIQIAETEEAIGKGFLPVLQDLMPILKSVTDFLAANTTALRFLLIAVGAVSGAILVANGVMKAYEAATQLVKIATTLWTGVQWLLNAALDANPIGLVVVAVGLLSAAIYVAYQKSDTFRGMVDKVTDFLKDLLNLALKPVTTQLDLLKTAFNLAKDALDSKIAHEALDTVKTVAQAIADAFTNGKTALVNLVTYVGGAAISTALKGLGTLFSGVSDAISTVIGLVQKLIDWLSKIKLPDALSKAKGLIDKINPFSAVAGVPVPTARSRFAYASGPQGRGRASTALSGASGGVTINLYGALDPEGTARAIRRVLDGHERRQGRASG